MQIDDNQAEEFNLDDLIESEPSPSDDEKTDQDEEDGQQAPDAEEEESLGKRAQKRIDKLTYQTREAERMNVALRAEVDALKKRQEQFDETTHKSSVERFKQDYNATREKMAQAKESGDTELELEMQERLIDMRARAHLADQARQAQPAQPQQPVQPAQSQYPVAEPSDRAKAWWGRNQWYGKPGYEQETQFASVVDNYLTQTGVDPNSDDYFAKLDGELHKQFTHLGGSDTMTNKSQKSKPKVASAAPKKRGQKSQGSLTPDQARIAKELGLTTPEAIKAYMEEIEKVKG